MRELKITTSQIAKICNVSQGTVDRALNNRPDISAKTKQKILEVARQYGYREYVKPKSDEITGEIGIIVFNLNNEYFSELITETEFLLRDEGLSAVIMMSHYDARYEIECIRNLYNKGVKGIILCSVNCGCEFINYLKLFDLPIVAVGNKVDGLPYVGIDDFKAMRELTESVLKDSRGQVIYFSPALTYPDNYAQRRRYEGFLSVTGTREYTVVTDINEICDSYSDDTVIICSSDYYAMQVHFKCPEVRVTGFDNIKAIDKYKLSIDSVDYSVSEIAHAAIDIIQGKTTDGTIISHRIVKR